MPGLHLPQAPYDLYVYDFTYDFQASWMATVYGAYDYIVYEHHAISCTGFKLLIVIYIIVSFSGLITSVGGERADFSATYIDCS